MSKTSRAIVGFAVAPFVPTCLFLAAIGLLPPGRFNWSGLWEAAVVVLYPTILFTLPITLAIGVPVYVAMERHSRIRVPHVVVTSGVAGAAVGLLLASPHIGVLLGLSAGITFWLIWHRSRDERPF